MNELGRGTEIALVFIAVEPKKLCSNFVQQISTHCVLILFAFMKRRYSSHVASNHR